MLEFCLKSNKIGESNMKRKNNTREPIYNFQPTLISIDWDFFPWNGMEAAKPSFFIDREGRKMDFWWMFDWGHTYRSDIMTKIWRSRKTDWEQFGLKIEDEFTIRPDRGCTTPKEFLSIIHNVTRIVDDVIPVKAFDSHDIAFFSAKWLSEDCGKPIHLIHFDAHHDLGYKSYDNIQDQIDEGKLESGSWLFHAVNLGYVGSVEIVYPDWKGMGEWKRDRRDDHIQQISDKIQVFTWKKWKKKNVFYDDVVFVGVAKSTPWTPPWLDRQYMEFVRDLSPFYSEMGDICSDCLNPQLAKGRDACKIREWDLEVEAA
jgi:hypothetical protein